MSSPSEQALAYDRVAPHYHRDVISPFEPGIDFRFGADVRRILKNWNRDQTLSQRIVIDFGCGIGEAIASVAGQVGFAAAIDLSTGMLKQCKKTLALLGVEAERLNGHRNFRTLRRLIDKRRDSPAALPTTVIARGNMLKLAPLAGTCDLAFAINSICSPSLTEAYRMFGQISDSIREGGIFIAVFASWDTMDYLASLERRHKLGFCPPGRLDNATGVYTDWDGARVKFFRPEEIQKLAGNHGLEIERLEKIRYPWEYMRQSGWGYYPGSPRSWDWYLVARKKP